MAAAGGVSSLFPVCAVFSFSHVPHVFHDLPVVLSGLDKETG